MIDEPESRYADYLKDCGDLVCHYVVEHKGTKHKCSTLSYASYLAEKFDSKVWNVVLEKFVEPFIGLCKHCQKRCELHFLPPEDDTLGCDECGSVYRIMDILMETGAYKNKG